MVLKKCSKDMVYKEFGMTPVSIVRDVAAIKGWLLKQPHLPIINRDLLNIDVDEWLENYLISSKNSVERAKENLDMYFTSKALLAEVFTCRDPLSPAFRTSCHAFNMGVTSERTALGRRVILFSHSRRSAVDFDPIPLMQRLTMLLDVLLQEGIDFTGLEAIIDCANVSFQHIAKYNLVICKKLSDVGLKALPQRIQRIHIVNPTSLVETGISLFKPLLPKKLQSRVVVQKDLSGLQETIDARSLPSDFGGTAPPLCQLSDEWNHKLVEYRQWFLSHDSAVRTDESKRVGKCRYETTESAFGTNGSFRKIEVD